MSERTQRALELRSIIDTELSKPFPRIPEVKNAFRLLGPVLHDLSRAVDAHAEEAATLRLDLKSEVDQIRDMVRIKLRGLGSDHA